MKQVLKYGIVEIGNKYNVNGSGRYDVYRAHTDNLLTKEFVLCVNKKDKSGHFNGKYDSKCSACWLNYGHTINKHNESINNA